MLRLHGYFKNGAIIQRNAPVVIKGYGDGEINVSLSGGNYSESVTVRSTDGKFSATLSPVSDCARDYLLKVTAKDEELTVRLMFGDVYITAGQSNMSYVLSGVEDSEKWIKRAKKQKIGVISLSEKPFNDLSEVKRPFEELEDFIDDYQWIGAESDEIKNVSAISVEMATAIAEKVGVPIGVVHTAMGGLGVESYLKREVTYRDEEVLSFLKREGRYVTEENYNNAGIRNYSQLQGVWNEKISPLLDFSFSGFVWYLGESSASDFTGAKMFKRCMEYIIKEVKKQFSSLPFVCVEIAPEYYSYGDKYGYMYVNEALQLLEDDLDGVYTVPIYDVEPRWNLNNGDLYFHPIHTTNKTLVSERIARVFTENVTFPKITQTVKDGDKIICKVKSGRPLKKGKVRGFTIASDDGKYFSAKAVVKRAYEIEVWSEEVKNPSLVTYAFTQYQDFCDLKDVDGNPVCQYRSKVEAVNRGYFFTPAFVTEDATEVYENNFGWQVGTCRKRKVWEKGKIYDASDCEISVKGDEIIISARPNKQKYLLFGASPTICLAGHKNHLSDFNYLNFSVRADNSAQFLGVVARSANGEVFRFALLNGEKQEFELPLEKQYRDVSVNLKSGFTGSLGAIDFEEQLVQSFVEIEFLFRARTKTTVKLKSLTFSDVNRSACKEVKREINQRADINLPT